MAQDMPLRERVTPIFCWVASSPWKSWSPSLTCSRKSSSKALSWAGVCFSRWARAPLGAAVSSPSTATMATASTTRRVIVIRVSLSGGVAPGSLVGAIVGPLLVGQARAEDLVGVIATAGVPGRVGDDVLAPHDVLVVDEGLGGHGQARPAHAVVGVAGIHARLAGGHGRDALGRIGPGPGGGEHAERAHLADLVVEDLMDVTVDVGDVAEGLEDLVDLPPVADPEVPGGEILTEGIVAEQDDGLVLGPGGQGTIQPGELVAADAGPGAGDAAIEDGHVTHALLGGHLLDGPEVGGAADGVEAEEAHAFVIEGPGRGAEELFVGGAHVEVPVVLAGDVELLDGDLVQDLGAELELGGVAELTDVAADDEEVGGG